MEFSSLLEKRKSIRKFKPKLIAESIEKEIISKVLLAPSAGNMQGFKIIAIRNSDIKKKLWEASYKQDPIVETSLVLVFLADQEQSAQRYRDRGRTLYSIQDATIATTYAHLITADLGLGSVWIGAFDTNKVQKILNLSDKEVPIAILPIGYPDEDPEARPRRSIEEIVQKID